MGPGRAGYAVLIALLGWFNLLGLLPVADTLTLERRAAPAVASTG